MKNYVQLILSHYGDVNSHIVRHIIFKCVCVSVWPQGWAWNRDVVYTAGGGCGVISGISYTASVPTVAALVLPLPTTSYSCLPSSGPGRVVSS